MQRVLVRGFIVGAAAVLWLVAIFFGVDSGRLGWQAFAPPSTDQVGAGSARFSEDDLGRNTTGDNLGNGQDLFGRVLANPEGASRETAASIIRFIVGGLALLVALVGLFILAYVSRSAHGSAEVISERHHLNHTSRSPLGARLGE